MNRNICYLHTLAKELFAGHWLCDVLAKTVCPKQMLGWRFVIYELLYCKCRYGCQATASRYNTCAIIRMSIGLV